MRVHLIAGEAGCTFARENDCVAVVVDALRASATAAMLLHAGATEILVVQEVEDALAAKAADPDALLYGERGGVPPEGFDYGNSPREASHAAGARAILTTTTGALRVNQAWGAAAIYMGSTVNATAIGHAAVTHGRDVVVIPAGLAGELEFNAQEDWAAAAIVVEAMHSDIGEGAKAFAKMRYRLQAEGIEVLFSTSPHAQNLRDIGLEEDIAYCAKIDLTDAVPIATERSERGVRIVEATD
ncbi:MAG: putative 2-phosphosulfolactate phosphatase [Phycisphaerae bacterium]|nr:MAG: putative 2-phosphosulfolactate phosphatase [Phycisphaerae bacterium]